VSHAGPPTCRIPQMSFLIYIMCQVGSLTAVQCNLCAGNMEAARQVLKRAAELKILSTEQITSLSVALVEDRSGSIQNGQIPY